MDGPRSPHDRNRRTVGGGPTYDVVAERARTLLARYRSRPVGARVTLTAGVTDVVGIHRHLRDELGFFEVGFSPVTAGDAAGHNLDAHELAAVFSGMRRLGEDYVQGALRDENIGFSNMHQLLTDVAHGMAKALPCGAGVGMLAVDGDGGLNLCHRFTGSSLPTFGTVAGGIDRARLGAFLEAAQDRAGRPCETCRIRHLCAGGCYHESYARYGGADWAAAHGQTRFVEFNALAVSQNRDSPVDVELCYNCGEAGVDLMGAIPIFIQIGEFLGHDVFFAQESLRKQPPFVRR